MPNIREWIRGRIRECEQERSLAIQDGCQQTENHCDGMLEAYTAVLLQLAKEARTCFPSTSVN